MDHQRCQKEVKNTNKIKKTHQSSFLRVRFEALGELDLLKLENLAKWQISAIADTGVVIALTRTLLLSVTPEVKDQAARTLALFQPTEYFQSGFRCAISNTNTGILLVDKLFLKRAGIHEAFLAKID